jgi:hypothetical protein
MLCYPPAVPVLDEALEILEDTGPEFAGGLSNHGPMAAEALVTLGRDNAVVPWVERYRRRLQEHPGERNPISRDDWREALGDGGRVGDWIAFFHRELSEQPWQRVVETWVPLFAPGIIASATHGVIRTGHAVRALAAEETPLRRRELAEGLGYWAARYALLPGTPSATPGTLRASEAVAQLETLPEDQRLLRTTITAGLAPLRDFPPFAAAINLVDTSGDASAVLSDLTETFARVYLANNRLVIHFIHAVTGPSAVRLLAPYVSADAAASALRYAWQAAAALYAASASAPPVPAVEAQQLDWEDVIDQAVATGDEHAIKFAEACLREDGISPSPSYIAAANDAGQRLRRN